MAFAEHTYQALSRIVGEKYITRDPAMLIAYSRVRTGMPIEGRPECILMPESTEEIQAIYRLANKQKFRVIPTGTFYIMQCVPLGKGFVTIDSKRMDNLWIDEKNMYAVLQPYVTFAQLQTEAMKRGLCCYIPGAGSQISVLTNLVFQGAGYHGYRYGMGNRSMLAAEWVLPSGEIFRYGSLTNPKAGYFWGEGPGMDLRGLFKGVWGWAGGSGMCTKIGIKLFPWRGPKILPISGISPEKISDFPKDKFRMYFIKFPTFQDAADVMYQIGDAEIAGKLTLWASVWFNFLLSLNREEVFFLHAAKVYEEALKRCLVIVLEGHTSEKQLEYEDKVLKAIVADSKGNFIPEEINDWLARRLFPELMRGNLITRLWRPTGQFIPLKLGMDTIDHAVEIHTSTLEMTEKFLTERTGGSILPTAEGMWINPYDFCHIGHAESAMASWGSKGIRKGGDIALKVFTEDSKKKYRNILGVIEPLVVACGPELGNFHLIIRKAKILFDPNNIANPPYPINVIREIPEELKDML